MQYHMVYPIDRWVSGEQLITKARDAISNYELDMTASNVEEAIAILEDVGEVTISRDARPLYS